MGIFSFLLQIARECGILIPKNGLKEVFGNMKGTKKKQELTLEEQAHRDRLRVLYNGIFVVTVLVWVCRFALEGLLSLLPVSEYYLLTALKILVNTFSISFPFAIFHRVRRDPFAPIFREKPRSEHPVLRSVLGILAVACLTLAALGLTHVCLLWLESNGVHTAVTVPDMGEGTAQNLYYILLSTLCYSFAYEFAFRGIGMRAMVDENPLCAVLVSGLAFAFSDGDPYLVAVRLAVGFLLGGFYLRVRALLPCILLQGACQVVISLWRLCCPQEGWLFYEGFLILISLVLGIGATFFLFFPRREALPKNATNRVSLRQIFFSFGIWVLVALLAFNMLVFTFSTDADPADPLLQPTPEEGVRPPLHFDRGEELEDYYGTENPDFEE